MNKSKIQTPLHIISAIVSFILVQIAEKLVSLYLPDKTIAKILENNITLKTVLPFGLAAIVFIIFQFMSISALKKNNRQVTPTEFDTINSKMKELVNNTEYIDSIQAYQYWCKNDSESKYIRLCFLTGTAGERIDINSILQTYYYFPYSVDKKLKNISAAYDNYKKELDPTLKLRYKELGKEFCKSSLESLNKISSVSEINKYHCELYRCTLRILSLISEKPIETILSNPEIEHELTCRRKTGILGSIIIHDPYVFANQSSSTKSNRIYVTFPYNVKKGVILLISINNESFEGSSETDIAEYCQQIISDINTSS